MRLVATPYRWMWCTAWQNVSHWAWDVRHGVRNLLRFFEAVWWFRSWDWTGMVRLLEISSREMRKNHENGVLLHRERYAKQLMIVETLCKRLREDEYFEKAGYGTETWRTRPQHERRQIAKHSDYMAAQDAKYLGRMMRFVQYWWD